MRKVLIPVLAASAAAAPAVAFAATNDHQTTNSVALATTTPTSDVRAAAKHKLVNAVQLARNERRKALRAKARKRAAARKSVASPQLQAIAACESGGNPAAIGGGGAYRGKYQFDYSTWASVGGQGDPAAASETEQDRRAAMLYRTAGAGRWPVCGR